MVFPYPDFQPAYSTIPFAVAITGCPYLAPKSIPA